MEIKKKKNWILKNYYIPVISIYGVLCVQYIFPIKSVEDLIYKLIKNLLVIVLSIMVIKIMECIWIKSFIICSEGIEINSFFRKRTIHFNEIERIEYEKGKKAQSGILGNQLRIYTQGKILKMDSSDYEYLEMFVSALREKTEVIDY